MDDRPKSDAARKADAHAAAMKASLDKVSNAILRARLKSSAFLLRKMQETHFPMPPAQEEDDKN